MDFMKMSFDPNMRYGAHVPHYHNEMMLVKYRGLPQNLKNVRTGWDMAQEVDSHTSAIKQLQLHPYLTRGLRRSHWFVLGDFESILDSFHSSLYTWLFLLLSLLLGPLPGSG